MSYLDPHLVDLGAECQNDSQLSTEVLVRKTKQLSSHIATAADQDAGLRTRLLLELSKTEVDLDWSNDAWNHAWEAFQLAIEAHRWEPAVMACDVLFRCTTDQSLIALGHGLWLGITFPIDPAITIRQLIHVIEETPEDSDGAAVAAAVAAYVMELRAADHQHSDLSLTVGQLLNDVARRHGAVNDPAAFDTWFTRLELNDPKKLLVRMRNIIDVLVQDQWWIDRDVLQSMIPPAH